MADRELVADPTTLGKTIIDIEMQGFDNYVFLILQAHNSFKDIKDDKSDDVKNKTETTSSNKDEEVQ